MILKLIILKIILKVHILSKIVKINIGEQILIIKKSIKMFKLFYHL